jgi:uncharacterized protein (DUF2147 family)
MRRKRCGLSVICGLALLWAGPALAGDIAGLWLTEGGESEIEIYACGDATCGRVMKTVDPVDQQGRLRLDKHNPDPSLRERPIVGIDILTGLQPAEDPDVWEGSVYNPRDGKTYDVTLTLKGEVLEVEGCFAFILCGSQDWTRISPQQQ